jgi:hypothetical protein
LVANVILALFNMLPAFPMDGGRVLRSLLAMWMPYSSATRYAAKLGQVMAVVMLIAGMLWNWPLVIIALMVFMVCTGELLKERFAQTAPMWSPQAPPRNSPNDDVSDTIDAVEVRRVR